MRYFLGIPLNQAHNRKVRSLCDKITESRSIVRVKIKPLTVKWVEDKRDDNFCDAAAARTAGNEQSTNSHSMSHASHASQQPSPTSPNNNNDPIASQCDAYDTYDSINAAVKDDKERIFWDIYNVLEHESDSGSVSNNLLRKMLLSDGNYDAGTSTQIIQDLINADKLVKVDFGVYKRRTEGRPKTND